MLDWVQSRRVLENMTQILVVMGGYSWLDGRGFESQHRRCALICCKSCNFCLKKTENKQNEAWDGQILKILVFYEHRLNRGHTSLEISAPYILWSQVWIQRTPSMCFLTFDFFKLIPSRYYLSFNCENEQKIENKRNMSDPKLKNFLVKFMPIWQNVVLRFISDANCQF